MASSEPTTPMGQAEEPANPVSPTPAKDVILQPNRRIVPLMSDPRPRDPSPRYEDMAPRQ